MALEGPTKASRCPWSVLAGRSPGAQILGFTSFPHAQIVGVSRLKTSYVSKKEALTHTHTHTYTHTHTHTNTHTHTYTHTQTHTHIHSCLPGPGEAGSLQRLPHCRLCQSCLSPALPPQWSVAGLRLLPAKGTDTHTQGVGISGEMGGQTHVCVCVCLPLVQP